MTDRRFDSDYDLTAMVARPLYFGMLVNVVIPAGLLFVCYYINNRYFIENSIPGYDRAVFYIFGVVAAIQAGLAVWWRSRSLNEPMVRRRETLEQDIARAVLQRSRPVFLLIASTAVWGFIYFALTGWFRETALFVVFEFVVFQIVRPRYGSIRKIIARQESLVEQGRFSRDVLGIR